MTRIIDEFPTLTQVENATDYQIVCWNFYLRPTMMNEELVVVKTIAQRYDRMPSSVREAHMVTARREYA